MEMQNYRGKNRSLFLFGEVVIGIGEVAKSAGGLRLPSIYIKYIYINE